jgi:Protein of unknown function (DUF2934)
MSRSPRGSFYENRPRASELHDATAHAHETGELHGKQEHLSGSEHSRQEFEHAQDEKRLAHESTVGHGIATFGHEDIAALAYERWEQRGCPLGSPDEDWFEAVKELRSRATLTADRS